MLRISVVLFRDNSLPELNFFFKFFSESAKLPASRALVSYMFRVPRAFVPRVPCALSDLEPYVLRALRTLVLNVPHALRVFVSNVPHALHALCPTCPRISCVLCLACFSAPRASCHACFRALLSPCLTCLVLYAPSYFMSPFSLRTPSVSYLSYSIF